MALSCPAPSGRLTPVVNLAAAVAAWRSVCRSRCSPPRWQRSTPSSPPDPDPGFRFKSGVELINVNATVSDSTGRFVPDLRQEDFIVYEDGQPQSVTHFSAERVPVSLGIVLDTSGSMDGEKIKAAQRALDRFLYDLLDPNDEIFLYRFGDHPILVQGWTTDRQLLTRALGRIATNGGTAMYDAVAQALSLVATAQNRKRALVVISDGNDTSSRTQPSGNESAHSRERIARLRHRHRLRDRLRFARAAAAAVPAARPIPIPIPLPFPPGKPRGLPLPPRPQMPIPPRKVLAEAVTAAIRSTSRRCAT